MLEIFRVKTNSSGAKAEIGVYSKDFSVHFRIRMQNGYDFQTKTGRFIDGDSVACKFSVVDLAQLIHCFKEEETFVKDYEFEGVSKFIKWEPLYEEKDGEKVKKGFAAYLSERAEDGNLSVKMGFNLAEIILLTKYFYFCMDRIFAAQYSNVKSIAKEKAKKIVEIAGKVPEFDINKVEEENQEEDEHSF